MSMRSGIREIIGKTISGVLVSECPEEPRTQVFLVFADGTHYELWGWINSASGVDRRGGMELAERSARGTPAQCKRYE